MEILKRMIVLIGGTPLQFNEPEVHYIHAPTPTRQDYYIAPSEPSPHHVKKRSRGFNGYHGG